MQEFKLYQEHSIPAGGIYEAIQRVPADVDCTLLKTTQPAVLARMAQHLRGTKDQSAAPKAQPTPAAQPKEASAPRPPAPSYEELKVEDARRMERYWAGDSRPLANGPNGAEDKPSTKATKGHE